MSLANLSTLSTCHDPVRCCGIAHQRSVSTESQLACGWQWTWAVGGSSYRERSWRRMCSSRWVALILVRRTQFLLREDYILGNLSSNPPYNGRLSEINEQWISFYLLRINGYFLSKSCCVSEFIDQLLICFTDELVVATSCRNYQRQLYPIIPGAVGQCMIYVGQCMIYVVIRSFSVFSFARQSRFIKNIIVCEVNEGW